jgi:hypothetical protein
MKLLIVKFVVIVLISASTSSCFLLSNYGCNSPVERLSRLAIKYHGKDNAVFEFVDSKENHTLLTIVWMFAEDGEYSTVGPVRSISISENGHQIDTSPQFMLEKIEDIDFESCQLLRKYNGDYIVLLSWGVGESLSVLNELNLNRND